MSESVAMQSVAMTFAPEVLLDEHYAAFVDTQVKTGRFSSAGAVIEAGLRLLEEQDAKLVALRQALIEGEMSGAPTPFDNAAFLKRMRAQYAAE